MTTTVLNIISVSATFLVAQVILFKCFDLIFGKVKALNQIIKYNIKIKYVVFIITITVLLLSFTEFHIPYSD